MDTLLTIILAIINAFASIAQIIMLFWNLTYGQKSWKEARGQSIGSTGAANTPTPKRFSPSIMNQALLPIALLLMLLSSITTLLVNGPLALKQFGVELPNGTSPTTQQNAPLPQPGGNAVINGTATPLPTSPAFASSGGRTINKPVSCTSDLCDPSLKITVNMYNINAEKKRTPITFTVINESAQTYWRANARYP